MLNLYQNLRDDYGELVKNRTKLFIKTVDEDGNILSFQDGTILTPEGPGTLFIVDNWLIPQIDKIKFVDGSIQVKDGEQIDEPVKSDIDLQEEELVRQLEALRAQRNEPAPE